MWTALQTADGSWTVRHGEHGATCHSLAGAWQQARERYAGPCRITELARERDVVRLLDIGTGLGMNLAAAARAMRGGRARLFASTFELEPSVLCAAVPEDDVSREWVAPMRRLLAWALERRETAVGVVGSVEVELDLHVGDARDCIRSLPERSYDAVFLDPFAPKVDDALWNPEFLADMARCMTNEALLSTYSASLSVRAALRRAGLGVGLGPRVGTKAEGTLASRACRLPPLDPRVGRKLERRSSRP